MNSSTQPPIPYQLRFHRRCNLTGLYLLRPRTASLLRFLRTRNWFDKCICHKISSAYLCQCHSLPWLPIILATLLSGCDADVSLTVWFLNTDNEEGSSPWGQQVSGIMPFFDIYSTLALPFQVSPCVCVCVCVCILPWNTHTPPSLYLDNYGSKYALPTLFQQWNKSLEKRSGWSRTKQLPTGTDCWHYFIWQCSPLLWGMARSTSGMGLCVT